MKLELIEIFNYDKSWNDIARRLESRMLHVSHDWELTRWRQTFQFFF